MDRMKTFFLYFLGIVGFFLLSLVLEDGLIMGMYNKMEGKVQNFEGDVQISDINARATNINGYMNFKLTNYSKNGSKDYYVKLDLFNERNSLIDTKYLEAKNLDYGQSKDYQVVFRGNGISDYNISILPELPEGAVISNGNNSGIWDWSIGFLKEIPWWGYAIGSLITVWYLPAGFLFGLFPL